MGKGMDHEHLPGGMSLVDSILEAAGSASLSPFLTSSTPYSIHWERR